MIECFNPIGWIAPVTIYGLSFGLFMYILYSLLQSLFVLKY